MINSLHNNIAALPNNSLTNATHQPICTKTKVIVVALSILFGAAALATIGLVMTAGTFAIMGLGIGGGLIGLVASLITLNKFAQKSAHKASQAAKSCIDVDNGKKSTSLRIEIPKSDGVEITILKDDTEAIAKKIARFEANRSANENKNETLIRKCSPEEFVAIANVMTNDELKKFLDSPPTYMSLENFYITIKLLFANLSKEKIKIVLEEAATTCFWEKYITDGDANAYVKVCLAIFRQIGEECFHSQKELFSFFVSSMDKHFYAPKFFASLFSQEKNSAEDNAIIAKILAYYLLDVETLNALDVTGWKSEWFKLAQEEPCLKNAPVEKRVEVVSIICKMETKYWGSLIDEELKDISVAYEIYKNLENNKESLNELQKHCTQDCWEEICKKIASEEAKEPGYSLT